MKQIKINSFRDIVLDDLEHIILNEFPRNNELNGHYTQTFNDPSELLDYDFKNIKITKISWGACPQTP